MWTLVITLKTCIGGLLISMPIANYDTPSSKGIPKLSIYRTRFKTLYSALLRGSDLNLI